jgi:hypothetical protein
LAGGKPGQGKSGMRELLRTNDIVRLSFLQALLSQAGITTVVLDQHMSVLEGSAAAIPRRLMVAEEDERAARALIASAEPGISA